MPAPVGGATIPLGSQRKNVYSHARVLSQLDNGGGGGGGDGAATAAAARRERPTHVLHCAASVRFDLPLAEVRDDMAHVRISSLNDDGA